MNKEIQNLILEIERLEAQLTISKKRLNELTTNCNHIWTSSYDPIIFPGGYDPGDPPGTMGIDWRGPSSWPERRTPRWKRVCSNCSKIEYTENTIETVSKVPKF